MKAISSIAAWGFGLAMLGLSLFVTADVICRKFFGMSFEGADELGGYALAVGAGLTFVVALAERAHMRIDLLYVRMPPAARAAMDWVALASLAGMAGLMAYLSWTMLADSISYHSVAPTVWATPLAWPQSAWVASFALFLLLCLLVLAIATRLILAGRYDVVSQRFGATGESEALKAELADLERRI